MSVVDVVDIKGSITGVNGFEVVRGYKSHVMNDVRNKIIIIVKICFERNCFCFIIGTPYNIIELFNISNILSHKGLLCGSP